MNVTFKFGASFRLEDLHTSCIYLLVPVFGYIVPVFAALVTAVNILAVVVFMQPRVRSHTTHILTLIACTDTLNILFPTITYVYYYTLEHYKDFVSYKFCFLTYILSDVSVDLFNALSLWFTVLLAYIRCRCLKSPFDAYKIHTQKRIALYIFGILVFTIISHLPAFFLFDFYPASRVEQSTNATLEVCVVTESNFVFTNSSIGRKVQILTTSVLDSVIPCFILVYLDFVILITLREAKLSRISLRRGKPICTHDISLDRDRKTLNIFTRGALYFRTCLKCRCFGNATDEISREISEVKEKNIAFYEFSDVNQESTRNELLPHCSRGKMNYSHSKRKSWKKQKTESVDSAFDKLDRESRRTSWLILAITIIITLHEVPLAIANLYSLIKHAGVALPINMHGCLHAILTFWQYLTYLIIFLMYAFMSSSFRFELKRILTLSCGHENVQSLRPKKVFMSPCSVRKSLSRERDATAGCSQDCL